MAAGWAGSCRLGALRAGNRETTATTEIDGETGRLVLAISIDPATPLLHQWISSCSHNVPGDVAGWPGPGQCVTASDHRGPSPPAIPA
jgi:hypothetical protein